MKRSKARKLIKGYFVYWMERLPLDNWKIALIIEEFITSDIKGTTFINPNQVGLCKARWQYMEAEIVVSLRAAAAMDPQDLEEVVVHELVHVFLSEMREKGMEHEERVASMLATALIFTKERSAQ